MDCAACLQRTRQRIAMREDYRGITSVVPDDRSLVLTMCLDALPIAYCQGQIILPKLAPRTVGVHGYTTKVGVSWSVVCSMHQALV